MKESENDVVSSICQWLEYKPQYFFWRQNSVGVWDAKNQIHRKPPKWCIKGVSDIIVLAHATVVFIECKTTKGKQSEVQKQFQADVERHGYQYILATSVDDVIAAGL